MNTAPRYLIALSAALLAAPLFGATANGTLLLDVMAKEKFPTTNFGSDVQLQVSNQATFRKYIYLQFSVAGIPAGSTGITAQLRLRSQTDATGRTVTAHVVSLTPTWTETSVTWNAKPALGTNLGTDTTHVNGQDSTFDVTAHVTGNGTYGLGLDTTFGGDTTFTSEEGGVAPSLVVTYTPPAVVPTVSFNATDFNASETSLDPATIQVVSSAPAPAGGLVVKYSISGSAEANHNSNGAPDYILSPANGTPTTGSVTIAQGATTANLTLTPIQDSNFEGKETAIFTITSDPAYVVGAPRVAQVVIADNEPVPTINPDHAVGDEGGWITPVSGTLPNGECSGMVVSRVYPGVHWYHRDATTNQGDPRSQLYAIEVSHTSNNGTVIKTIDITAPAGWSDVWGNDPSHQWEDAAEDPDVPGVIWIGDIGNNNGRNVIRLFKVNEPSPYGGTTSVQASAGYYLKYPTGVSVNAECLFIFEGIPHIITKEGTARIYRSPTTTLSTNSASPTLMELVGNTVSGGGNHSVSTFSADRKRMALSTHGAMWVYESQSALDPVNNQLTPAQAMTYIQDLLCTRAPVWAVKHNGGKTDPEVGGPGSIEGGSFVGGGHDVLLAGEGKQVVYLPAWWYETQPAPLPAPPAAPTVNNSPPDCFLFKPINGASFSKAAGSFPLQAVGSDYDGTISNIKFYQKLGAGARVLIGTGTSSGGYHQITWDISGIATGSYTVSADATDNSGAVTTDSVTITINP